MAKFGRHFELLSALVASGHTVRDACKSMKLSESRAYHISQTPEFKTRVSELRTAAVEHALGKLSDLACNAVDSIGGLLSSQDENVRLRAAQAVLDRFAKLSEQVDLRQRIEALEAKQ
jgi:hypothetical protein